MVVIHLLTKKRACLDESSEKSAKCGLVVKSNYSMKRHVERKHQAEDSAPIETQKRDEGNQKAAEPTEETRKKIKNKSIEHFRVAYFSRFGSVCGSSGKGKY